MPDAVPVVVTCLLCDHEDAGQIVTLARRAWIVAVDHALDFHRDQLMVDETGAKRSPAETTTFAEASFTITESDDPKPLRRRVCLNPRIRSPRSAAHE